MDKKKLTTTNNISSGTKSTQISLTAEIWPKVQGILCKSLQQLIYQYEEDSIGISLFSANDISDISLDQLDQSFMYEQLIKEIRLELEYYD
ncbi:unnamed protein product [Rotaria sp. Silwood1]|nr:unnamed protein product [Rotaria sp. Silwood1]CAF4565240.1 unnamed protein product [Rotaria sp. Silwood1]CAF4932772.1 unnamed protein product [Rotaria sp. Silwood1]